MSYRPPRRIGTADVAPGVLLYHRQDWLAVRRQAEPGAYLIALPRNNSRLRSRLLAVGRRLLAKGLRVQLVEMPVFPAPLPHGSQRFRF